MTETDTIKVREADKERLDELMDGNEITEYGSLSYADAVQFVLDQYEAGNTQTTERDSAGSGGVNKRSSGSDDSGSQEVEDKINSVRVEDNGGTRNNSQSFRGERDDGDEEEVADLSADELEALEK